jgi:hypothetical protein
MKRNTTAVMIALAIASMAIGCGGAVSDGGQSGTGLSAIRGNVVAAPGTKLELADIRVSLSETNLATTTDDTGQFELHGRASGPGQLSFERERDGLSARTHVVIPAGGVLELSGVVLDPHVPEANPMMRGVEFKGFVEGIDCPNGVILVTARDDERGTVFSGEVASATISQDGMPLTCSDLQVGDLVLIDAETPDGLTLVNSDVVLEGMSVEGMPGER